MSIINDNDIDLDAAISYLSTDYDFDLLPIVSDAITLEETAHILDVSLPTVQRLIENDVIKTITGVKTGRKIAKNDLLDLILRGFLAYRPIEIPEKTQI